MVKQNTIVVKNAMKNYGIGIQVLNGLNMTVSKGIIYGLLGASACGKTTLLSCIVGVQRLDKGEILVLGGSPGTKKSGIPGPRVGYMPQEISLPEEFSRSDAFYYFGRINGLESDEIKTRQTFFSEILQLPSEDHLVKNMSGGEQRRVSLAAALIHKPELLILDEPTVGLDSVLRENIWSYLIKIARDEGITVVITTHYIEEAKNAIIIGFMRSGKLLAETSPQRLLERFQCESLEEVFLTLSRMQEDNMAITDTSVPETSGSEDEEDKISYKDKDKLKKHKTRECEENLKHEVSRIKIFKALIGKNGIQILRNHAGIVFAILFPILQISTFFIGVGIEPHGLTIGIVNKEANNCNHGSNLGNITYDEATFICHFENLSCRFLGNLGNSIVTQVYYSNMSDAITAAHNGKLFGVIHFNQNFSEALQKRIQEHFSITETDILASEIQISLDMGDGQVGLYIKKKLFDRFFKTYKNIMTDCKISPKFMDEPVRFENPIYGNTNMDFAEFMAPGYILCIIFFLATTVSTSIILIDRQEGIWKRNLVQGVTTTDMLLSSVLIQTIIVVIHTVIILCLSFPIWGLKCKGSLFWITCLSFLSGFCGLTCGFLISVISTNIVMAHAISNGNFMLSTLISGCLWPVEAMPKILRWIGIVLPLTVPTTSFRAIMIKGHSIEEPEVYHGFLIIISWILFFLIICLVILKLKSS